MAGKSKGNVGRRGDGLKYLGFHRGKKRWEARLYWTDARTSEPREKRVKFYATSKGLALQERDRLLALEIEGTTPSTDRKRFKECSAIWFETVESRASRTSWGSHRRKLDGHFGEWWVDKVSTRDLQDFLDSLRLGPGTVNSIRDVAVHVLGHAVKKGWATRNPAKDTTRRSTRLQGLDELGEEPRRALTTDEAAAYLADLEKHEPEAYPLVLVQLVTGCRFAEVSALHLDDVDLEAGTVRIRRGQYRGTKGRTKGRYARLAGLPLPVRVILRAHIERMRVERWPGHETLLFPRPPYGKRRDSDHWSIATVHHMIRRSFKRLGWLDGDRPVKGTTHVARHTLVTIAEEHATEAVLRKVVGHTSSAVHAKYKHPAQAKVIDLAEAVGRRVLTGSKTGSSEDKGPVRGQK